MEYGLRLGKTVHITKCTFIQCTVCCGHTVSAADRPLTQALRLLKERSADTASLLRADADFSDAVVQGDINSSMNLLDGSAET